MRISPLSIAYPDTFVAFPSEAIEGTLVDRFEAVVSAHADAMAVCDRERRLTYGELNEAANRLAHHILSVRPPGGETVAFFAHHDIDAIIAIWGILKCGKTYLALNASFPAGRVEALLQAGGAACLLADARNDDLIGSLQKRMPALSIIEACGETASPAGNPGVPISKDVAPYMSYTSGTTGEPKITLLDHRGLLTQVRDYSNDFGFCPGDRFALLNPLSFGGGSFCFLGAMLNGGALCLYDLKEQGLQGVPEWIATEKISVLNMPPPVFRSIFGSLPAGVLIPAVRITILAGDTMISRDVEIHRQHFPPGSELVNMLGTTDVGLVCRFRVERGMTPGAIIPVGKPFASVEVAITDEAGNPLPRGREGIIEIRTLYVSGIPRQGGDAYALLEDGSGRVLFRSEDLGRLREDGTLEHLGRKDSVIKVYGMRIDLAEVEALLYQHPAVREAVVMPWRNKRHLTPQLVAYIVPAPGTPPAEAELYKYLSWKLPFYMMPNRFFFLERLPLNASGKVDRQQLPEPDWDKPAPRQVYTQPRNPVELQLCRYWQELLQVKRVGIHDNFFSLGGNSLLALQMVEWIEAEMKVRLPIQSLMTSPTVAEIASLVSQTAPLPASKTIMLIRDGDDRPGIFMIPGGARTGVSLMEIASRLRPGPKIHALEYPGMDGHLEPMDDLKALAAFMLGEIRSVQPHGPYHLVGPCLGGVIAFEMAQQARAAGEPEGLLVLLDSTPPNEDMERPRQYAWHRTRTILRNRQNIALYLSNLAERVKLKMKVFLNSERGRGWMKLVVKLRTLLDQLRYVLHRTGKQRWLDHRLDRTTWAVFNKLQIAKKSYRPAPYAGRGLVILNQMAEETQREQLWAKLLASQECFYIAGTSHQNIFGVEASLDRMAELINERLPV